MFDLFPSTKHLHPIAAGIYALCAVIGTVVTLITLLFVIVELTTRPGRSPVDKLGVACALLSATHVILEARSKRPLSIARWLAFAAIATVFVYEILVTIKDPTGRVVVSCMFASGALLLFVGRWLYSSGLRRQER